jgi:hypothetical protein
MTDGADLANALLAAVVVIAVCVMAVAAFGWRDDGE